MTDLSDATDATEAIRGLIKLLDDGDLVRNTDGDGDAMHFIQQGVRITNALKAAQNVLESEVAWPNFAAVAPMAVSDLHEKSQAVSRLNETGKSPRCN